MTVDREQARRDAEWILHSAGPYQAIYPAESAGQLARHCLALLAELEQAEKERDGTAFLRDAAEAKWRLLEARLAKVPALVEAAEHLNARLTAHRAGDDHRLTRQADDEARDAWLDALAAWESK